MSGEPPEGTVPGSAPPGADAPTEVKARISDEPSYDGPRPDVPRRSVPRPGGPPSARRITSPPAGSAQLPADIPPPGALPRDVNADEAAPTERRPSYEGVEGGLKPGVTADAPPEIPDFLSAPAAARASEAPPSAPGSTRRRSRRTVKIPDDAVPHKAPAPVAEVAPFAASAALAALPAPIPVPASPAAPSGPPVQLIPPAPPVPTLTAPRPAPTVPRPASPPAPASPPVAAESAARPPAADDAFEVIRPMRIINIGSRPPPPPEQPVAAPPAPAAPQKAAQSSAVDDAAWEEPSPPRPSRPPLHASPELSVPGAGGSSAASIEKPPKPPAVEEVEAIEDEAAAPPKPPAVEEVEAIEEVEPEARGGRTDEIEPLPDDEVVVEADRISDVGTADEIPVEMEDAAPPPTIKKPPPPPPKRPVSIDPPPQTPPAPPAAPIAAVGVAPPAAPPGGSPSAATPPPPPAAPAAAPPPPPAAPAVAAPPPPPAAAAPAAPPAAPPQSAPASTPTVDLAARKRQKPWWEEIFSDDYLRTMEKVEHKAIRRECDFIEDRLGLEKGAVMLDLACGAGMHAVEMASRGYNVVGYDLSLAMLARAQDEAQERGQKLNFLQGDMREMAFEEAFDGMYCWSTSFGYFDDEKNVDVLSRIRRGLRQGGMLLLDVINRDYVAPRQPSLVWFEGEGCVCMDEMFVDFFTSRLRVKRTVMFEDGRSRECDYGIRLYGLHELGKMLHECGFKVVEVTGHPAHPGVFFGAESPRIIVLAERA
jgi:ubiquinone/menaquinone biosynthesis C-methylase UbiE